MRKLPSSQFVVVSKKKCADQNVVSYLSKNEYYHEALHWYGVFQWVHIDTMS